MYANLDDLKERFGEQEIIQLTDRENLPATTIDDSVVDEALGDATSLIDSYLKKRYKLPLASVPKILTRFCSDIARFYLYGSRADKDGEVQRGYEQAHAWLKDVAKGTVELQDAENDPAQAGDSQVKSSGNDRTFTQVTMKGYI